MRLTYQSINGMLGDETWKNAARGCEGLKKGDGRQEAAKRQHRAGAATCYRGIYSVSTQLLIHKFPCLSTSKVAIFAHAGLPTYARMRPIRLFGTTPYQDANRGSSKHYKLPDIHQNYIYLNTVSGGYSGHPYRTPVA